MDCQSVDCWNVWFYILQNILNSGDYNPLSFDHNLTLLEESVSIEESVSSNKVRLHVSLPALLWSSAPSSFVFLQE